MTWTTASGTELKPGGYGCVRLTDFFGTAIRVLTKSNYSHSFITLGGSLIAEARPHGFAIGDISEYQGKTMVFDNSDQLTDVQRVGICATARTLADAHIGYGFLDIAWLGLHYAGGINWNWLMEKVEDDSRMICSQAVAFCGKENGVNEWLCGQPNAQEVVPGMLAARCPQVMVI
jgi:hypothetical protein